MFKYLCNIFLFLCISCQTAVKRTRQPEDLILNVKKSTAVGHPEKILSAEQVKEDLTKDEAEKIKAKLEEAGATVELK